MKIPSFILRKLYVQGSLAVRDGEVRFLLRNTLATATLTGLKGLRVGPREVAPSEVRVRIGEHDVGAAEVAAGAPLTFPRHADAEVRVRGAPPPGPVRVRLEVGSAEFGDLLIEFEDEPAAF